MTQLDDNTAPPVVLIDVAHTIHCFSSDLYWADRLPARVNRLLSRLSLTELPERDAAVITATLSRCALQAAGYGRATLDRLQQWLQRYRLGLRH
jgi:hypothetical protein